jgi:hypothetical protein
VFIRHAIADSRFRSLAQSGSSFFTKFTLVLTGYRFINVGSYGRSNSLRSPVFLKPGSSHGLGTGVDHLVPDVGVLCPRRN